MLAATALKNLARDLAAAIDSMGLESSPWGRPDILKQHADAAERLFQGYTKASGSSEHSIKAARVFLAGRRLDDLQRDAIAPAVARPMPEFSGAMVLAHKGFPELLDSYDAEARGGDLWRVTWHGLLHSYFSFELTRATPAERSGWALLREFLERTWPLIDARNRQQVVPDWILVLRREAQVLTESPAGKYAESYLRGSTEDAERLAGELGIPLSSWFWHALVLAAVRKACAGSDSEFRQLVSTLIQLIQGKPAFRDEALEMILIRYHACRSAEPHEQLRDYVCRGDVWKNPKLRAAGIATAWNRVPELVWQMVLSWVNERNLKDFFDILAARNNSDEGRLAFWSRYLKQITWTRLVFGAETMALQRNNEEIRNLIAREQGAFAKLTSRSELDGFMMRIGQFLVIEFSKKPSACYVYRADDLPFDLYAKSYEGGTADLAAGFRSSVRSVMRIVHRDGWAARAALDLRGIGIQPDSPMPALVGAGTSPTVFPGPAGVAGRRTRPDLTAVRALVARFRGAGIQDLRDPGGTGKLWVTDPLQRTQLEAELKALGFEWSARRQAWFHPGS